MLVDRGGLSEERRKVLRDQLVEHGAVQLAPSVARRGMGPGNRVFGIGLDCTTTRHRPVGLPGVMPTALATEISYLQSGVSGIRTISSGNPDDCPVRRTPGVKPTAISA